MKWNKKLKTFGVVYLAFWVGAFGLVVSDRFNSGTDSVLSEIAALAGAELKNQKKETFFASPYAASPVVRKPVYRMAFGTRYRDRRAVALKIFLDKYNSPMADQTDLFIFKADQYHFDWRLMPAISMMETAGGRVAPGHKYGDYTYNAFGFKTKEGYMWFDDWADCIRYVSERFAKGYGVERLDPDIMEATYCPPCAEHSPGKWSSGVKDYMSQIQAEYNVLEAEQ